MNALPSLLTIFNIIQEMYSLSTLMNLPGIDSSAGSQRWQQQGSVFSESQLLLEQAVIGYNTRPGTHLDALRATVLLYEAWKSVGNDSGLDWTSVSRGFVRVASTVSTSIFR